MICKIHSLKNYLGERKKFHLTWPSDLFGDGRLSTCTVVKKRITTRRYGKHEEGLELKNEAILLLLSDRTLNQNFDFNKQLCSWCVECGEWSNRQMVVRRFCPVWVRTGPV